MNRFNNLSGLAISIMMVIPAIIIAATEIISAILTNGVRHELFVNRNIATVTVPTKLVATKNTKFEI